MLWLLLILLVVVSGMVSASETALFGLSRRTLIDYSRSPSRSRVLAYMLMQHPRRVLMVILIANTAVNVSIFTVSVFAIEPYREHIGFLATVCDALVPISVIIFGELLPKAFALSSTHVVAPVAAGLVSVLQIVLGPLQWLLARWMINPIVRVVSPVPTVLPTVSTEELKSLVDHSAQDGVITSAENEMLQAIVSLEDVSVREVMTPRVDIQSIHIDSSRDDALKRFRSAKCRRMPVYNRNLDDIRGILHVRDLVLNPDKALRVQVRKVHFVPEQQNLIQLLQYFLDEHIHIAVVVDEYGGTAGMVTSEDVIEWIVGDLPDAESTRTHGATEQIDDNTFRIPGNLGLHTWADRFAVAGMDGRLDTVAGLILSKLGRWPRVGDSIRIQNLTLVVERMQKRRIESVLLRRDSTDGVAGTAKNEGNSR